VLPTIARALDLGPAAAGALSAAIPVGIMVGFPIAGRWIRTRSTESLLPISALVVAAGTAPSGFGDGLPGYFLGRFVMGLGSCGIWMGVTYTTLERWPAMEYLCMSRVFAAYSAGALLARRPGP
jgi:predicted MFS family arabinose efflux permease